MYFGHCMENLKCQKDWDKLGENLRAMVYNTYSTVKTFAQDTIFFIGQSIEDIQNYFAESNEEKTYEHPVGIIYPQNQPLNKVQKQEILQIIGDVLENYNHVTDNGNDNQLKKNFLDSIGTSANLNENLTPNIEILPRSVRKTIRTE